MRLLCEHSSGLVYLISADPNTKKGIVIAPWTFLLSVVDLKELKVVDKDIIKKYDKFDKECIL